MADHLKSILLDLGQPRALVVHVCGSRAWAYIPDAAAAMGTTRSGLRGILSRMKIATHSVPELKARLGLMGRVRFLGRDGIERLIKERISDRRLVERSCRTIDEAANGEIAEAAMGLAGTQNEGDEDAEKAPNPVESEEGGEVMRLNPPMALPLFARERWPNEPSPPPAIDVEEPSLPHAFGAEVKLEIEAQAETLSMQHGSSSTRNRFMNLEVPEALDLEVNALDDAIRFTESTQRKMELSFRVWSHVCQARGWDANDKHPTDERLLQFVYVCLHKDCGIRYSLYSFRDVYVPMLFRYFDNSGYVNIRRSENKE